MNLAAFSPNMLQRLQAGMTARKTTPAKPASTSAKPSRPLIIPSDASSSIRGVCPSCDHDFEVNLQTDIYDGFLTCPSCEVPGRVANFSLRNARKPAAPAAPHRPAARPTAPAAAAPPAVVYVNAPSQAKRYFQVIDGETVEVGAALADFIGRSAMLGADWKRDVLGVDPNAATRQSQNMNRAYAENLRNSRMGGGQH